MVAVAEIENRLQLGSKLSDVVKNKEDQLPSASPQTAKTLASHQTTKQHTVLNSVGWVFCPREFDSHTKIDQEERNEYKTCTCRLCGEKADGRDCLICDSCEEMYHVSCIESAVEEIPTKSWYCATCIDSGIHSPHENCVVCETMNKTLARGACTRSSCTNEDRLNEPVDNSNCGTDEKLSNMSKRLEHCKICDGEIQDGDKTKICIHRFCPNKFYHERCLTKKQLKSSSPGWYCPSCLCRSCLIDKDDSEIIICDGCDHAYHIYCLIPEQTTIPEGQWFCRSCDAKLQATRTAKRAYENSKNKQKKKRSGRSVTDGKWKGEDSLGLDKGGGMEMLLTAVNTLNCDEELAGV
ncbi:hypothetical protein G4B88_009461 [Cannabis sativa]|uniref:PHD-type domain-containing protein n=1 Tax=Cannabis sativa TaxID=3483 RepID=A0A7J6DSG6_CANSA|nr:hypothetical protein G4B88_009461 [Cannabis sativa]